VREYGGVPHEPGSTFPAGEEPPPTVRRRFGAAHQETGGADDLFAEISRSPLDDRPLHRRSAGRWVAAGAALGLAAGGTAAALLLLGGNEASSPAATAAVLAESPPGLVLHTATYDPAVGAVLLFGGEMGEAARLDARSGARGEVTAETWLYRGAEAGWARLVTSEIRPAPRAGHAAALATDAGLLVVFGGSSSSPVNCQRDLVCSDDLLADTWTLDSASGTWEERHPATAPPARMGHVMAYDAGAQRVILFGGTGGGGTWSASVILHDTWAYDPSADTWEQRAPAISPPGRVFAAMAYDPEGGRVLLWGGASWEDDAAVWAYDYRTDTWTSLGEQGAPLPRWNAGAAYDPGLEGLVVAGGIALREEVIAEGVTATQLGPLDQAWLFRPANATWAPLPAPSSSGVTLQARFAAAYDPGAGMVVVYGGVGSAINTLLFDGADTLWIDATPAAAPQETTIP